MYPFMDDITASTVHFGGGDREKARSSRCGLYFRKSPKATQTCGGLTPKILSPCARENHSGHPSNTLLVEKIVIALEPHAVLTVKLCTVFASRREGGMLMREISVFQKKSLGQFFLDLHTPSLSLYRLCLCRLLAVPP